MLTELGKKEKEKKNTMKILTRNLKIEKKKKNKAEVLGARVRYSAHGKGHEEGGST